MAWKWLGNFYLVMVIGLFLAGWYYFRTNPDVPERPTSSTAFTIFLIHHRHHLKVLALTGLSLALVALGAVCLGNQAWWPLLPLGMGALVLRSLGNKIADPKISGNRDWQRVPTWLRAIFTPAKKTADIAFLLIMAIFVCWNLWRPASAMEIPGLHLVLRLVLCVEIAFLYGLESLFFEYGELRSEGPA
ncbi:MAG: hypothetical protein LAP61_23475 [Acidobacteriia bacterium]|nr:hypothetical protein [Terriglobia bacterium]